MSWKALIGCPMERCDWEAFFTVPFGILFSWPGGPQCLLGYCTLGIVGGVNTALL